MAIKTTKTLRLSFRSSEGKSTSMILANAADNLPADKVKDAMNKRTVTPVFDDSEAEVKDAE